MPIRNQTQKAWVVIPASGIGSRMESTIPKQYLKIAGKSLIEHTLHVFNQIAPLSGIVVALSNQDQYWKQLKIKSAKPVYTVKGGKERYHSVFSALNFLQQDAHRNDWILVHDAARPCLTVADINKLFDLLAGHPVGGLLATPVTDTLKQANQQRDYLGTLARQNIWSALTPQMFRYGILHAALAEVIAKDLSITDDAEAIEIAGFKPKIIHGRSDNIKVTNKEDLIIAEYLLGLQQEKKCE